jgi:hypothetical protein
MLLRLTFPLWLTAAGIFPGCERQDSKAPRRLESHARMLAKLKEIRTRTPDEHPYLGTAQLRHAESVLAALPADAPAASRFQAQWVVAYHLARLGQLDDSTAAFEDAYRHWDLVRDQLPAADRQQFLLHRASAFLRLGETQNCVHCQNGESCILPLKGAGVHSQRAATRKSVECLRTLLEESPEHLTAKWLLNIATMALGEYPDGVPEPFRVDPEKFRSESSFPRFQNVAHAIGVDEFNLCGGTAIEDFDNDGLLDIFTTTWDTSGEPILFRNLGNGRFERRVQAAGLEGLFGGLNVVQADYDNDDNVDVLVLRGGWLGETGRYPNSLLQNDGSGRFRDVTYDAGLGRVFYATQTAAWSDYDNDVDLDLYVGNENGPCQLFENDGKGQFVDVAAAAGVQNERFTKGVVWGDYDNDTFPDLYVSNYQFENRLYHNNRDGTFTDVAPELGVTRPIQSFPVWFWDYNNDGVLDLYVSSWWPDVKYVAAQFFDVPHEAEPPCLYEGTGRGTFREVAAERHLTGVAQPMGANFGDLDNDGWPDMYLGTGYPEYDALMPNLTYRNAGGMQFEDVTMAGGFGHLQKGHGVAFADLDNDGDQDIHIQMGGAFPGDGFSNVCFENPGFRNHWIGLKLVGRQSNRSAIGSRICVVVSENGESRSIYKWVNSGGSFGANPLQQQIGLGSATGIERIEVFWPRTGATQVVSGVATDQFVEVTEGVEGFRPRSLKSLRFPEAVSAAGQPLTVPATQVSVPESE